MKENNKEVPLYRHVGNFRRTNKGSYMLVSP